MDRYTFIERCLIQIYGGVPTDDREITFDLINNWIGDAAALAAKQNYKEAITIEGIEYVNNGFYSTFSGIVITSDDTNNLGWQLTLPEIPPGIGRNESLSSVKFKDSKGFVSQTGIFLSMAQDAYSGGLPAVQNKIICTQEGKIVRMKSPLLLNNYTAVVRMISSGDNTNLDSELNVPPDYFYTMVQYIQQQLLLERQQKQDQANDGTDQI